MTTYFTLLTPTGLAKIANAQLTQNTVAINQVAVGDSNGVNYTPTGNETALKKERWRGGVASVNIDATNPNWIVVEAVIPSSVGGFTLREVALYDVDGDMIAIGNYPDTYKPLASDGSTMDLVLRTIIEVSNASSITLRIDPNVIVASRKYVDDKITLVDGKITTHLNEIATPTKLGHIKPDGITIRVDPITGVASGANTIDTSVFVLKNGTRTMDNLTVGYRRDGVAVGEHSLTQGQYLEASGRFSTALGSYTRATKESSFASGESTVASGAYSFANGLFNDAKNFGSTSMGSGSKMTLANADAFVATADAFVIGNGNNTTNSNAFRVTFDGKVYGRAAFNSTGADYAEYFEWTDSNLDSEDRVGFVVTLDGDKIRKSLSTDDYILGIISVNPSVIGDSHQDDWQSKYVTDEWGRIKYHYVDVEYDDRVTVNDEFGSHNQTVIKTRQDYVPILNPQWNSDQEYVPRENRKEWSPVGLMGKLLVRDDGTCEVNSYAKVGAEEGVLTASVERTDMRVIERVAPNIVRVFIK